MPRKPSPREAIRKKVFKAVGLGTGYLHRLTRPDIQRVMQPYAHRPYPTRRFDERAKVPIEYSRSAWGTMQDAYNLLLKDRELAKAVAKTPGGRKALLEAIDEAVHRRGLKAYEEEWRGLSPKEIDELVMGASGISDRANVFNARIAIGDVMRGIDKLKKGKHYTIMDLGTGGGKTLLRIVHRLKPAERKKLKVILVDVMPKGLRMASEALSKAGVPKENIVAVKENMARIGQNPALKEYVGDVDLVTSGAAMHHMPDVAPTFRAAHGFLKKGGTLCFWDWGHAAWRAPSLLVAPAGVRVIEPGLGYERGVRTAVAPAKHAFISREKIAGVREGRAPTELAGVRNMLSTWIALLKFPESEQRRFEAWFDRAVTRGEPINFADYMKRLEARRPAKEKRARIRVREGHRPPELYQNAIVKAGFGEKPFTLYSTRSPLLYQMKVRKK